MLVDSSKKIWYLIFSLTSQLWSHYILCLATVVTVVNLLSTALLWNATMNSVHFVLWFGCH